MAETLSKRMTVDEFFEWQQRQDRNYEFVDGVPVLTNRNDDNLERARIQKNTMIELALQLQASEFEVQPENTAIITHRGVRRPDVVVARRTVQPMVVAEPHMIVHILLPFREGYDVVRRLDEYREISSVHKVVLADTSAPQAMIWQRRNHHWESAEKIGLLESINFPNIGAKLTLSEMYHDAVFRKS